MGDTGVYGGSEPVGRHRNPQWQRDTGVPRLVVPARHGLRHDGEAHHAWRPELSGLELCAAGATFPSAPDVTGADGGQARAGSRRGQARWL